MRERAGVDAHGDFPGEEREKFAHLGL